MRDLYRAGYALDHILLLADAPLEADRGSALCSRAELLDLWNKENGFRPEVDPLDHVVNAAPSVLAQAGSLPERGIWGRMRAAYLERLAPWEGPGEFRPGLPRAIAGVKK